MEVLINDFWRLTLRVAGLPLADGQADAVVTATQLHDYTQRTQQRVEIRRGGAKIDWVYPLVDDGRFDPSPKQPREGIRCWAGGRYRFTTTVRGNGKPPRSTSATLNVDDFRDRHLTRYVARPTADHQFLECAPDREVVIDHDRQRFWLRTIADRVAQCTVQVDVVAAGTSQPLAGPWRIDLTKRTRRRSFSVKQWASGEYWIRLRALHDGQLVGPYCVRIFAIERSSVPALPEVMEVATATLPAVDKVLFDEADGAVFAPVTLQKQPDAPLVEADRPWELPDTARGSTGVESIRRNESGQYEMVYTTMPYKPEDRDRWSHMKHAKYVAVSSDGDTWQKPELGLVEFNGSKANNILSNRPPR